MKIKCYGVKVYTYCYRLFGIAEDGRSSYQIKEFDSKEEMYKYVNENKNTLEYHIIGEV